MLTALIALSLLAGSDDPEGVISTAPGGVQSVAADAVAPVVEAPSVSLQTLSPHGLTTAQQIDRWVGERASKERPFGDSTRDPFAFRDDRKIHGEVTAGIGTNDYSSYGARVSIPFGETGRVDLSYRQTKNAPWGYGYGYGYPGAYGYGDRASPFSAYDDFYGSSSRSSRSMSLGLSWDKDRDTRGARGFSADD